MNPDFLLWGAVSPFFSYLCYVAVPIEAQNNSRPGPDLSTTNYGTADEPSNSITTSWVAAVLVVIGVGAVSSSFTAALLRDGPFKTVIWYPIYVQYKYVVFTPMGYPKVNVPHISTEIRSV